LPAHVLSFEKVMVSRRTDVSAGRAGVVVGRISYS
jgi:hypothetical protein